MTVCMYLYIYTCVCTHIEILITGSVLLIMRASTSEWPNPACGRHGLKHWKRWLCRYINSSRFSTLHDSLKYMRTPQSIDSGLVTVWQDHMYCHFSVCSVFKTAMTIWSVSQRIFPWHNCTPTWVQRLEQTLYWYLLLHHWSTNCIETEVVHQIECLCTFPPLKSGHPSH